MANFLFLGGGFFGYAVEIIKSLELRGHKVIWFEDRPGLDFFTKAAVRFVPSLVASRSEMYFKKIADEIKHSKISEVLVIKGESLSLSAIKRLRDELPKARFTLYFWDSYRNMPRNSTHKVGLFDKAFSFDLLDAQADSRLVYRPLFFLDEYAKLPKVELDIDLVFFGTVHSDRYAVLNRLARILPANMSFEKVMYFPSSYLYGVRRLLDPTFWSAERKEFIFKPLSKVQIQNLVARAKIVVDIERPVQAGLTMRTIEILGAGKKLITTNPLIKEADFYHPNNHIVVDRASPYIPPDFFEAPWHSVNPSILNRYSLSGWLDEVVGDKNST